MIVVELGAWAFWTLAPVSAAVGIAASLVFRWSTDRAAVHRTSNLILAHLLEFRLFLDEPSLVLRAQWELVRANIQMLRLVFLPCLIMAVPLFFLIEYLNDFYGLAPLQSGRAAVIRADALKMPEDIVVEAGPVHAGGATSWRVRPLAAVSVRFLKAANPHAVIPFPSATILRVHWLVWLSLISSASAIGLKYLE